MPEPTSEPAPSTSDESPDALRDRVAAGLIGTRWRHIEVVASTGSTNRDLSERASGVAGAAGSVGEVDGLVRIALHQTAGRGRFDRRWQAPPGAAVAISVGLRPARAMPDWSWLPLVTGVAVRRGIARVVGDASRLELKWPNDVLVTGATAPGKLCGILCERHETPGHASGRDDVIAVLGFGINTRLERDQLPVETATSLRLAGWEVDTADLLIAVLRELDALIGEWEERGHVREAYEQVCGSIGADLRVHVSADEIVSGRGHSIDEAGRLVVMTDEGLQAFSAGDVVHLRRR